MFKSEFDMREAGTWAPEEQTVTDTICPYCGVGCTLSLHVQDNRIVKVTSPSDSSVTEGHLCVKGRFGYEFVQVLPKGTPRPGRAARVRRHSQRDGVRTGHHAVRVPMRDRAARCCCCDHSSHGPRPTGARRGR